MAKGKLPTDDPFAGTSELNVDDMHGGNDIIDFGDIETPMLMENHTCRGRIVKAATAKAKSGHRVINLVWLLITGPYEGKKQSHQLSMHPNAASITKQTLMKLGMPERYRDTLDALCRDILLETEADLTIKQVEEKFDPEKNITYDAKNVISSVRNASKASF